MIAVVLNAEAAVNHFGHALGGPQLGTVTVCQRALRQVAHESSFLCGGEHAGAAGGGLGFQRVGSAAPHRVTPAHNAAGSTPDSSSHFVERKILVQPFDCVSASLFQGYWRAMWSHGACPFW